MLDELAEKCGINEVDYKKAYESGKKLDADDYLQYKCSIHNSRPGNLPGYDCPKCMNRGNFMKITECGNEVIAFCDCMKIREQYAVAKKSGMLGLLTAHTFENFKTDNDYQKGMKDLAQRYVRDAKNEWFVMVGQSGAGKTHICSAVCDAIIKKGETVKYELWSSINARMDALRFSYQESESFKKSLRNPDIVLYIDDFLKTDINSETGEFTKPAHKELMNAFDIINSRVISGAKTIISSELMIGDIIFLDSALGGRIWQASGKYLYQIGRNRDRNYRFSGK